MPAVSVIIPVYNGAQTIEKCVESLVLGLERDLEVILVEDGSKDGSWESCQLLARTYPAVRCLRNEENRGVSYSRNRGLEIAAGAYICFVDCDDWVSRHYVAALLSAARENPQALPVCGLHFINTVDNYRRVYLWPNGGRQYLAAPKEFFDLHRYFLLPQLWNKIFRRDLIENHHLRFDESLSMGEDFQFVLDYLKAAHIPSCLVLNQPLYYYTRTSTSSLMSAFGHRQQDGEFSRYQQLNALSGNPEAYAQALDRLKENFVYHSLRDSKLPRRERLAAIERLTGNGTGAVYDRRLRSVCRKEALVRGVRSAWQYLSVQWGELCRRRNQRILRSARAALGNPSDPVTIFSQNCIGGMFYKDMGLEFASPTIGAYFSGKDFVRFLQNWQWYLAQELELSWEEEYPIGHLGDIRIHFMHYATCRQAKEAWQRRCQRVRQDRILALCTDRDGFSPEDFEVWKTIPYPKVLFTANKAYRAHEDSLYFPEYGRCGAVGELIPHRKFYRSHRLTRRFRDLI